MPTNQMDLFLKVMQSTLEPASFILINFYNAKEGIIVLNTIIFCI
jgi:hypothetical protein